MGHPVAPNTIGRIQKMIDDAIAAIPPASASWGFITGALVDQGDLQTELDDKASLSETGTQSFNGRVDFLGSSAPQSSTAATSAAELVRKGEHDADQLAQNVLLVSYLAAYQPLDATLTDLASWGGGTNDMIYATAPDTFTYVTTESWGRGLLSRADAGDLQTYASLVPGTDIQAYDSDLASIATLSPAKFDFLQYGVGGYAIYNPGATGYDLMNAASAASALSILGVGAVGILDSIGDSEWDSSDLSVTNGGTGASNEEDAKENLMIGVDRGTDFNHFIGSGASQMRKSSSLSGSGTTATQGWEWTNTTSNWLGAMKCETGTTSTGRAQFHTGNNLLIVGSMAYAMETLISVEALSTVSEEYLVRWGFADNVTSATAPTRAVQFRYDRLNDGVNWQAVTRSGGVETVTDTGVAVTAGFTQAGQKLKFVCDADGSEVRFYIANSLVATHTTNINTASRMGTIGQMIKSAGTTEVGTGWDWERFSWSTADDLD